MQTNMGNVDRTIRILLGLAVLSLVFLGPRTAWGWLGLIPLVTAAVGYCPLYSIFGIRTSRAP